SDRDAELHRIVAAEASAPFALERGPVIRGRLVRIAEEEQLLLLTMHHIVSDGWSMDVLARELTALYAAYRAGAPDPLSPLPVQYADYAAWQRQWVDGEVLAGQAAYWRETLAGAPELLELPTDRPRPLRWDYAGATLPMAFDATLTAGLKALSRRHGTTLFHVVLAAWAAVLSRLSGQDDVVIGTPTANRNREEIEGLIGFFVNTLALRVELSGSPTAEELLRRAKARALAAQEHQDIPFEQVVDLVQPARSLAHTPLFQVMLAWQNAPRGQLELAGLRPGGTAEAPGRARQSASSDAANDPGTAKFDLVLSLGERGGQVRGSLEYATALFDRATVERHVGYLRRVLEGMAADEQQPVARLPFLPESERRQLVEEWNATTAPFPGDTCLHALVARHAIATPGAPAVVMDDRVLTYADLLTAARRLAHELRRRGVRPGARVVVLLPRSIELVVAELAVVGVGAAYVPIDPGLPASRLAFLARDSGAQVVMSGPSTRDGGAALADRAGIAHVSIPVAEPPVDFAIDADADTAFVGPGTAAAAAYVMYTSGSTGEPKGVIVPQRAITRLVLNNGYAALGPGDRVAFAANPMFDASTFEVWGALLTGGCVVVFEQATVLDSARFGAELTRQRVSVLWLTAGLFSQYADELAPVLGGLRYLIVGGDVVDAGAVERVQRSGPPAHLLNGYGPTETTTFAVTYEIPVAAAGAERPSRVPLGRPIANTRVYVLDRAGEPVPVGAAGELYIGGPGVAHGYLNRPVQTAERFVPDRFCAEPGGRLYRTGDLTRWRADGVLEYLGRTDHQVKLRGFRVELGEIEARLLEHAGVREAVVLLREDRPGDKRLVAYYVAAAPVEVEGLRGHLGERLPEYMVPAACVRLDALPLTPNGKVDRKALPAPEGDAYASRGYEAPVGETEAALAEVWSELLGVERVGRGDHFFELGGHSLLAVRVISRVRQVLGADMGITDLFERPVLADLARAIESAVRTELPPIERVERGGRLPLSFAQQRLWFLEQMGDLGSTYHIPTRLRLGGALDRAALRRALDAILARHEALRTTFVEVEGEPVQRIAPPGGFRLVEHDLGGHPDAAAELRRLAAEEAGAPFDLEHGPLIRGRLIRLAEDDHLLQLTMHHIVSDGWSMGVLTRELGTLYDAFRRGEADPLPPLPVQY
ncbi:MAG TPA: amino acid adenylation domain-containing protein, partial [Longimicrobium sp.]|nr:amino acid adenylation domain-containing protein [Longimicrobium sp.]